MKKSRSILQKFGPLVLITGLLLGVFAVQGVLANVAPDSTALQRQQLVVTALRVERSGLSTRLLNASAPNRPGAEIQPGNDHNMDVTETEVEPTQVEMTATPNVLPTVQNTPGKDDDNPEDNDDNAQEINEHAGRVEFQGQISAMNGDSWTVDGMTVLISSLTEIKGNPQVGDMVKIEGVRLAGGSVQASQIEAQNEDNRHEDQAPTRIAPTPGQASTPGITSTPSGGDDHGGDDGGGHDGGGSGGDDGGGHH